MAAPISQDAAPPARRARRLRFRQILVAITVVMHVPVALAVCEVARRLGAPAPGLVGLAWASLGTALFAGRVRAAMSDSKRSAAGIYAVDVPYFIHWCAAGCALLPALAELLVLPLADLAMGRAPHVPMGAIMWTYLIGLVVSAYGVLKCGGATWFRVVGLPRRRCRTWTRGSTACGLPTCRTCTWARSRR